MKKPPHPAQSRHGGFPVSTSCCELAPSREPRSCSQLDPGSHGRWVSPGTGGALGPPRPPRGPEPTASGTAGASAHMEPPALLCTCRERPMASSSGRTSEPLAPGVGVGGLAHNRHPVGGSLDKQWMNLAMSLHRDLSTQHTGWTTLRRCESSSVPSGHWLVRHPRCQLCMGISQGPGLGERPKSQ